MLSAVTLPLATLVEWRGLWRVLSQEKCMSFLTGTAQHEQDEAYEEAAYLKTNRFLAAYVVDEQSRASYVNDLLNEGFQHVRVEVEASLT